MRIRLNPKNRDAKSYKHVKICKRWQKFQNFYDDMYEGWKIHNEKYGGRNTTLDRINTNGDYSPKNCRWATQIEQARNKRTTIMVTYKGKRMPLVTLCEQLDTHVSVAGMKFRLKNGYTIEEAINYKPWQGNRKSRAV